MQAVRFYVPNVSKFKDCLGVRSSSVSTGRDKSLMNVFEFHNPQPIPPVTIFSIQLCMFWIVHEVHQVKTLVSDPFWISERGFRIQKPRLWN